MIIESLPGIDGPGPRSLSEQAYQRLVEKITRLEFAPNAALVEKDLMADLGLGRTPIREALQRLAVEGLVCHLPHRGMFVCEMSEDIIDDSYKFHSLVDGYMARLAASAATKEDIRELDALHADLVRAIDRNDLDAYMALDRSMCEVFARASKNSYIEDVVTRFCNQYLRLWFYMAQENGDWREMAREHQKLMKNVVDAVSERQPEDAELSMKLCVAQLHQAYRGHV